MSDPHAMTIDMPALHHEVTALFHIEAELLDDRRFEEWLELLDESFRYVIPAVAVGVPEASERTVPTALYNSLYDDTKATLTRRIRRLRLPTAWAENPPSRTCRLTSNIRIAEHRGDALVVRSSFAVYKARFDFDSVLFVGRRRDILRGEPGNWRFADREVTLVDSAIAHHNISVLF